MTYFFGLDLGQASDYTAAAIIERTPQAPGQPIRYECRHLERMKLGTPYPAVADRVVGLLAEPVLRGRTALVVDATGVGRPVVDMLRQRRTNPVAITITGGDTATSEAGGWRVPKRDLVGALQVLLQAERLKFAAGLPMVSELVNEMLAFRVKINTQTAHDSYGAWREGSHDDLVLAVAVAVWYAEHDATRPRMAALTSTSYWTG